MSHASLLGSRVELALDMVVVGEPAQGHELRRAGPISCLLGSSTARLRHNSPHHPILHYLWQVGELALGS